MTDLNDYLVIEMDEWNKEKKSIWLDWDQWLEFLAALNDPYALPTHKKHFEWTINGKNYYYDGLCDHGKQYMALYPFEDDQ